MILGRSYRLQARFALHSLNVFKVLSRKQKLFEFHTNYKLVHGYIQILLGTKYRYELYNVRLAPEKLVNLFHVSLSKVEVLSGQKVHSYWV